MELIIQDIHSKLNLSPSDRLLDIGCGSGAMTRELARRVAFVLAVDSSVGMVERAGHACADITNVRIEQCMQRTLRHDDCQFDKIICYSSTCNYFENYKEIEAYLCEIKLVARKGAWILAGDLLERGKLYWYMKYYGLRKNDYQQNRIGSLWRFVREDHSTSLAKALQNRLNNLKNNQRVKANALGLDSNMANCNDHF